MLISPLFLSIFLLNFFFFSVSILLSPLSHFIFTLYFFFTLIFYLLHQLLTLFSHYFHTSISFISLSLLSHPTFCLNFLNLLSLSISHFFMLFSLSRSNFSLLSRQLFLSSFPLLFYLSIFLFYFHSTFLQFLYFSTF